MFPLPDPPTGRDSIAADNIAGIDSVYKNTQGTAICKIFDLTAAVTGLNEKTRKKMGYSFSQIIYARDQPCRAIIRAHIPCQ